MSASAASGDALSSDLEVIQQYRVAARSMVKATKKLADAMKTYSVEMGAVSDEMRKIANIDKHDKRQFGRSVLQMSGTFKSLSGLQMASVSELEHSFSGLNIFVDFDYQELNVFFPYHFFNNLGDPEVLRQKIEECKLVVAKKVEELEAKKETRVLQSFITAVDEIYTHHDKVGKVLAILKKRTQEFSRNIEDTYGASKPIKEGIVSKRSKLGPQKLFLAVRDGKLFQFQLHKDFKPESVLDIITCTVRAVDDERRKFEIISPTLHKPLTFEAESETERDDWMKAIQCAVSGCLNALDISKAKSEITVLNTSTTLSVRDMDFLHTIPGNSSCVDFPDWASINFGILMCLECSGVHRSMGTHVSKVRSLTLDKWSPELLLYMRFCGNKRLNEIFEVSMVPNSKPVASSERALRETWIKSKYDQRKFVQNTTMNNSDLAQAFYNAIPHLSMDISPALRYLAGGVDLNTPFPSEDNKTLLFQVVIYGNVALLELLIQNGANLLTKDSRDCTVLHYCAFYNRPRSASRILTAAPKLLGIADSSGVLPLEVAVWNDSVEVIAVLKGKESKTELTVETVILTPETCNHDTFTSPRRPNMPPGPLSDHIKGTSTLTTSGGHTPTTSPAPPGSTPPPLSLNGAAPPPPPTSPPPYTHAPRNSTSTPPPKRLPPPPPTSQPSTSSLQQLIKVTPPTPAPPSLPPPANPSLVPTPPSTPLNTEPAPSLSEPRRNWMIGVRGSNQSRSGRSGRGTSGVVTQRAVDRLTAWNKSGKPTDLDLSDTDIVGGHGLVLYMRSLISLNLSRTQFGRGEVTFWKTACESRSLKKFYLAEANLTREAAEDLRKLIISSSIEEYDLSGNPKLGPEAGIQILEALKTNKQIIKFLCQGCDFGEGTEDQVLQVLTQNKDRTKPKTSTSQARPNVPSIQRDLAEAALAAAMAKKRTPPKLPATPEAPQRAVPSTLGDQNRDPLHKSTGATSETTPQQQVLSPEVPSMSTSPKPSLEPPQRQPLQPQRQPQPPQRQASPPQRQSPPPQRQSPPPQKQSQPPQPPLKPQHLSEKEPELSQQSGCMHPPQQQMRNQPQQESYQPQQESYQPQQDTSKSTQNETCEPPQPERCEIPQQQELPKEQTIIEYTPNVAVDGPQPVETQPVGETQPYQQPTLPQSVSYIYNINQQEAFLLHRITIASYDTPACSAYIANLAYVFFQATPSVTPEQLQYIFTVCSDSVTSNEIAGDLLFYLQVPDFSALEGFTPEFSYFLVELLNYIALNSRTE
ncbi:stromal membrane-associated GTPase-activating protein 2 [Pelomyxa schiedti]|nr:stromal membrane-associated GTPase-activating protein 2 [Pelomyxa schiedti]